MSNLSMHGMALQQTAAPAGPSTVPSPRLVSAAHEFEAQMMKELMAPLAPGHDLLGGGEDEEGSSSALSSFASEAMGKAISEHGGLGIAKSILHQLTAKGNHSGNPSVPAILNGTTTKSPLQ